MISEELIKLLEAAAYAATILTLIGGVVVFVLTQVIPWMRERTNKRALQARFALNGYSDQQLDHAFRYYIPPYCQQTDPSGHEESRALALVQEPLFSALSRELAGPAQVRHIIILADSGMGKTSAVLNYCARHLRTRGAQKYGVRIVHLGSPDADTMIQTTENKNDTVLFLDALDEDTKAIENHQERIRTLVELARPFRSLVITCRTQFFSRDEEIPKETGIIKPGPRPAGEGAEYLFYKLYLSPFTDDQIGRYIRRRYPIWQRAKRDHALAIVSRMPQLSARPMLLAHVDDLIQRHREYSYAFQIYEEMVQAWIRRESGFVRNSTALLHFSQRLAVDIYINRGQRGAERIGSEAIGVLARQWGIPLQNWELTGRSLLNRDVDGYYKFAHRSILEHLFVERFWEGDEKCAGVHWTDQMMRFLIERIHDSRRYGFETQVKNLPVRSPLHAALLRELGSARPNGGADLLAFAAKLLANWLADPGEFIVVNIGEGYTGEKAYLYGRPPESGVKRLAVKNGIGPGVNYYVAVAKRENLHSAAERARTLCTMLGAVRVDVRSGLDGLEVTAEFGR